MPSTTGFLVFGHSAADVTLTLTEKVEVAGVVSNATVANTWAPLMIAPPGFGPAVPTPSPLLLHGLVATDFYNVGLQVNPVLSPTLTHLITIVGTNTNTGAYIGEVLLRLEPALQLDPCRPFIFGGYQSADIILIDLLTNTEVPLGGTPGSAAWDSLLRANTNYGFAARVHNDSDTPAVNTVVRFWNFPGGNAATGILVDIQTVTVPANGTVIVHSAHPFRSEPLHRHSCAVVSIYNAMAGRCNVDAVNSVNVPNPGGDGSISCSAWRNTDSRYVYIGIPWELILGFGIPHPIWVRDPLEIKITAQYVPFDWKKNPKFIEANAFLKSSGLQANKALFLLPALRETFKPVI